MMDGLNLLYQFSIRVPGVVFAIISSALLVFLYRGCRVGLASRYWPSVRGIIKESSVEEVPDSDGCITYRPKIVYAYRVEDREYESKTWSFRSTSCRKKEVSNIVDRYVPGSEVDIYYDPENPSQAVLERGITPRDYVIGFVIVGIIFLVAIGACFVPWPSLGSCS
jgi:hypothetical protein